MGVGNFIKSIQTKTYEERMRIFWVTIIIIGLVTVSIWVTLIKFSPPPSQSAERVDLISSMKESFNETRELFSNFQVPKNYDFVTVTDFLLDEGEDRLTINIEVRNPTYDILNFLNNERSNLSLIDGQRSLAPLEFTVGKNDPFPLKILSQKKSLGRLVFEKPQNRQVVLYAESLYFEGDPQNTFNETVDIDLDSEVKGIEKRRLPRE